MARLVPMMLMLLSLPLISASAQAAEPFGISAQSDQTTKPHSNFDVPDQSPRLEARNKGGTRIFAGRELVPNGVIGLGLFGQKAEKGPHSAATARDLSLPKQRKAAVGFSLKF